MENRTVSIVIKRGAYSKVTVYDFTYLQLDSDYTMDELWEKVKFTTYPQIFLYDYPIGGYTALQKSLELRKEQAQDESHNQW